jgi:hypothetical protein
MMIVNKFVTVSTPRKVTMTFRTVRISLISEKVTDSVDGRVKSVSLCCITLYTCRCLIDDLFDFERTVEFTHSDDDDPEFDFGEEDDEDEDEDEDEDNDKMEESS